MRTIEDLGISPAPWESHKQFVIANDDGSVVAATNVRDARLIAAVPDLYRALREAVVRSCDECAETNIESCRGKCHVAAWREVLAKAAGEEAK